MASVECNTRVALSLDAPLTQAALSPARTEKNPSWTDTCMHACMRCRGRKAGDESTIIGIIQYVSEPGRTCGTSLTQ